MNDVPDFTELVESHRESIFDVIDMLTSAINSITIKMNGENDQLMIVAVNNLGFTLSNLLALIVTYDTSDLSAAKASKIISAFQSFTELN